MDPEQLRNKVKELATDAVKCDKLEEYEKAYDLYVKAANQLQLLMKVDQNPYSQKIYKERAIGYAKRAKDIKEKKLDKKDNTSILHNLATKTTPSILIIIINLDIIIIRNINSIFAILSSFPSWSSTILFR